MTLHKDRLKVYVHLRDEAARMHKMAELIRDMDEDSWKAFRTMSAEQRQALDEAAKVFEASAKKEAA